MKKTFSNFLDRQQITPLSQSAIDAIQNYLRGSPPSKRGSLKKSSGGGSGPSSSGLGNASARRGSAEGIVLSASGKVSIFGVTIIFKLAKEVAKTDDVIMTRGDVRDEKRRQREENGRKEQKRNRRAFYVIIGCFLRSSFLFFFEKCLSSHIFFFFPSSLESRNACAAADAVRPRSFHTRSHLGVLQSELGESESITKIPCDGQ